MSRFYRGLFIILLFPELSLPITKKSFQIKLSCVLQDDEKLTHIIEAEQFSFKSHASFCRSTATIIKLIRKPVTLASFLDTAPQRRSSIVFGARVHCFVVWCIVFSANQRRPCKSCDIALFVHRLIQWTFEKLVRSSKPSLLFSSVILITD